MRYRGLKDLAERVHDTSRGGTIQMSWSTVSETRELEPTGSAEGALSPTPSIHLRIPPTGL